MHRWNGLAELPSDWGPCVATIGVFDGVHRGHQRVMARAGEIARSRNLPVMVITFDRHPEEVIRPGSHPPLLTTARRRTELLSGLGAHAMCVLPFTLEFSRLGPDEFVQKVLAERLHVAAVVVGEDFRFGHKALGDVPVLARLGENYGFTAEGIPLVVMDGKAISSSDIRERLASGDVDGAARALGRPHRMEGVVVRGHMRGRGLGFPTANLKTAPHTATPADGVYAGWLSDLSLEGAELSRWPAAVSVSTNPTFGGGARTIETHVLDQRDLDLYGVHVAVDFAARIRGTRKFESADALVSQIRKDVLQVRELTVGLPVDKTPPAALKKDIDAPLPVGSKRNVIGERPYDLAWAPDGMVARIRVRGSAVLTTPQLNREPRSPACARCPPPSPSPGPQLPRAWRRPTSATQPSVSLRLCGNPPIPRSSCCELPAGGERSEEPFVVNWHGRF